MWNYSHHFRQNIGGNLFAVLHDCKCLSEAKLAEISTPDSDLDFLCKNWSPSSCSDILLRNAATYTTPWDPKKKPKTIALAVCRELVSKFSSWIRFCWRDVFMVVLRNRVYVWSPASGVNMKDPASKSPEHIIYCWGAIIQLLWGLFIKEIKEAWCDFIWKRPVKIQQMKQSIHDFFFSFL